MPGSGSVEEMALKLVKLYLLTAAVFVAPDVVWLTRVAPPSTRGTWAICSGPSPRPGQ